ncbi:MAG: hypothetical protein H6512_10495 [Acidimicrobiia bacterium]|nr:hypothetical protein [Acidimicrobiia bacterium]
MATLKPAKLRFYVDADTLGLAHLLTAVRSDVTYPGDPGGTLDGRVRPPCDIAPSTPDQDWIPIAAERGLIVITRDRRISQRSAERAAVRAAGGRHIAVTSRETLRKFAILEIVICQWRNIEELSELPGPYIYGITRTSSRKLDDF